jgi:ABC-type branched-subunit amino acid transport system substrate-binding protein
MNRQSARGPHPFTRRALLRSGAAVAAVAGAPGLLRAQSGTIKVGMSAVTTGRFAYAGLGQVVATKLLFEQVNAAGGIEGRKFELIVRDSRNLPEEAVKNVRSLINAEGCTLIMSAESSLAAAAINEGLRDTKVVCFQMNSEAYYAIARAEGAVAAVAEACPTIRRWHRGGSSRRRSTPVSTTACASRARKCSAPWPA